MILDRLNVVTDRPSGPKLFGLRLNLNRRWLDACLSRAFRGNFPAVSGFSGCQSFLHDVGRRMRLSLSLAASLLLIPQIALCEESSEKAAPVIEHAVTGKQLDEWCEEEQALASVYVQGILDEAQRTKNLTIRATKQTPKNSSRYERYLQQFVGAFCLPPDLSNARATMIACKWMSEHSWQLERPASALIARSFKFAFPCLEE